MKGPKFKNLKIWLVKTTASNNEIVLNNQIDNFTKNINPNNKRRVY